MENITVVIGSFVTHSNYSNDNTRKIEFSGERVGSYNYRHDQNRGVDEVLYRTGDGRLVVHKTSWSHWQGEGTDYSLEEVQESDLQIGGGYEALGIECGYGRSLTLDEALAR